MDRGSIFFFYGCYRKVFRDLSLLIPLENKLPYFFHIKSLNYKAYWSKFITKIIKKGYLDITFGFMDRLFFTFKKLGICLFFFITKFLDNAVIVIIKKTVRKKNFTKETPRLLSEERRLKVSVRTVTSFIYHLFKKKLHFFRYFFFILYTFFKRGPIMAYKNQIRSFVQYYYFHNKIRVFRRPLFMLTPGRRKSVKRFYRKFSPHDIKFFHDRFDTGYRFSDKFVFEALDKRKREVAFIKKSNVVIPKFDRKKMRFFRWRRGAVNRIMREARRRRWRKRKYRGLYKVMSSFTRWAFRYREFVFFSFFIKKKSFFVYRFKSQKPLYCFLLFDYKIYSVFFLMREITFGRVLLWIRSTGLYRSLSRSYRLFFNYIVNKLKVSFYFSMKFLKIKQVSVFNLKKNGFF